MHPSQFKHYYLQSRKTKQLRAKIVFPILPMFKNNKFSWLRKTKIIERKYYEWIEIVGEVNKGNSVLNPKWKLENIIK